MKVPFAGSPSGRVSFGHRGVAPPCVVRLSLRRLLIFSETVLGTCRASSAYSCDPALSSPASSRVSVVCSAQVENLRRRARTRSSAASVQSPTLDAVGALEITYRGRSAAAPHPHRTGPLTAKHCAIAMRAKHAPTDATISSPGRGLGFVRDRERHSGRPPRADRARGSWRRRPRGASATGPTWRSTTLGERVDDVVPLPVAREPLIATDVGRSFVAIGYGIRNQLGWSDTGHSAT